MSTCLETQCREVLIWTSYPVFVRIAINGNEPARKDQLDSEISARQSADANLQAQLSDTAPLEASAFSPISWHDQVVENSVVSLK
jgi:hypothetical protein